MFKTDFAVRLFYLDKTVIVTDYLKILDKIEIGKNFRKLSQNKGQK